MFWGDFIEIFCSLHPGGREVEKFQKNGKTSEFSNWPKTFSNVSTLVLMGFFSNFYLPVHPGDQKFEQKLKKIEFLKVSKNALKSFQTSCELVLRYFSGKNFCPVHPGWSKLAKNTKKWKNFETFKILQKRSQKNCLIMCCMIISTEKNSAQCTLETRKSSTEIEKNSNFIKCPKMFPRLSKHVLKWFFRDFLASAPWRVETSKKFKEMQKLLKIQDTQIRFQKCSNKFWICFEVFSRKKVPSAHWRVETWNNSKKKSKTIWNFKSVQKRSLECPNMFWGDFIEIFCSLHPGGREVEKFQKNGKTSEFSNWPKTFSNVSTLVLMGFFSNFYLPVHPGDQKFEQKLKKIEFLKVSKNVLKSFETSSELVLRYFSGKNFCPVHPGWSKLAKNTKKWKNFETFKILQKRSQKHCLIMCCMIISTEKNSAQCTLETRKSSTEIEKNSNFQKCPKTFPRLSKHVLMWFFRDFLASAPWRVETSKNFKKMQKLLKIQDTQTRFQKCPNKFWTCFEVFSRKKVPSTSWRVETWKNLRKIEKLFFSKWPKSFPKVFKLVFNMLRGIFSGKKIGPVHPGGSRSRKISKKWKKIKFSKPRKTFPKVSKFVLMTFFEFFSTSAPWRSKIRKKIEKIWIPKSVQERS